MERACDNCKRVGTKWCSKCVSTAQEQYSKFKPNKTWLDSIFKECMDLEKAMNELRSEKTIIPTQEEEKNMEYKTKEELQSSIEKMEAELAKMKEALKNIEEPFWKPKKNSDKYFYIDRDFSTYFTYYNTYSDEVLCDTWNCFETEIEAKEVARDLNTLLKFYRLSRKSMERDGSKNPTYYITQDAKIGQLYNVDCSKTILHFASALEAQRAIEIIGKENLIELFKKF